MGSDPGVRSAESLPGVLGEVGSAGTPAGPGTGIGRASTTVTLDTEGSAGSLVGAAASGTQRGSSGMSSQSPQPARLNARVQMPDAAIARSEHDARAAGLLLAVDAAPSFAKRKDLTNAGRLGDIIRARAMGNDHRTIASGVCSFHVRQ
jgi:hypothetical protein